MAIEVFRFSASTGKGGKVAEARIQTTEGTEDLSICFGAEGEWQDSAWRICFDTMDFADLATAMVRANQDRALKAFAAAQAGIEPAT